MLSRPVLNVEDETLDASNSYIAVRVPVEVDERDTSGPVSLLALKLAGTSPLGKSRSIADVEIVCAEGLEIPGVGTLDRPEAQGLFPNLSQLWPREDTKFVFEVMLSPADLAAAMGARDGVVLSFVGTNRPIVVTDRGSDAQGLLMPIRMDS